MIRIFSAAAIAATALGMTLAAAAPAVADEANEDSKNAVEYRQSVMASIGGHTGAIARIVRQEVPYDHIAEHARSIALTAPTVDDIWPENSSPADYERTDALARIWDEPDRFQSRIDDFKAAAEDFAAAAETGETGEIMPAFQALGESCSACHDDYRAE